MNSQCRFTTLHRLAFVVLGAFGILSIIASGGGGGGGDGGGGPGGGYTGNTSAAMITTTNASTLIGNVMGTSDPTGGVFAASSRQGTSGGQSLFSARALSKRLMTVYQATVSQMQTAGERAMPAFDVNEDEPCDNPAGVIHVTGTLNDSTFTGTLLANYVNCLLDGLTYNGQATLTVTVFDLTYFFPTDFTFTIPLSGLMITGPGVNLKVTGSLRDQLNIAGNTETITFNLVTTDNVSGKQIKTQNLVFFYIYGSSSYTLNIMGRVYDSVYGYVDVSTVASLVFSSISQFFPDSGQMILIGQNNARIRATALSATMVKVELDLDSDSVYELTAYLRWIDIGGPIGADLGDDDMDGLHNSWETNYGFDPFVAGEETLDPDGDGFNNLAEYQAGTDPNDINSHP